MNTDLSAMSQEELLAVLDEAEEQIAEIRAELQSREEAEQHDAIEALDFPVTRTAVEWDQVRAFFRQVLEDLRGKSAAR